MNYPEEVGNFLVAHRDQYPDATAICVDGIVSVVGTPRPSPEEVAAWAGSPAPALEKIPALMDTARAAREKKLADTQSATLKLLIANGMPQPEALAAGVAFVGQYSKEMFAYVWGDNLSLPQAIEVNNSFQWLTEEVKDAMVEGLSFSLDEVQAVKAKKKVEVYDI